METGPAGGEHPVTAESLANPNLDLTLIVPAGQIEVTGSAGDENNPIHVWSGLCTTPCGLALRNRQSAADLTGLARIRWTTKMSGYHQIRPIVKLADGTWLVGDLADGSPRDWLVSEISYADLRWMKLDITRAVATGTTVDHPDLSKVDEIGFVDLMPASGHGPGGWSDVAQIEVYAKAVASLAATGRFVRPPRCPRSRPRDARGCSRQQRFTVRRTQIDDFDPALAQPVDAAAKRTRLTDHDARSETARSAHSSTSTATGSSP